MKKILYFAIAAFVLTACQKDPDFDKLSEQYSVFTTYDPQYTFTGSKTIYVPTSITVLSGGSTSPTQWSDADANKILDKFVSELTTAGYDVTRNSADAATLNLNVSYAKDVTYFVDYPYWWWDPYWWDGGYWPGWYYPYPYVYGYATVSLIGELVLPNAEALKTSSTHTVPAVWYSFIAGADYGSRSIDTPYIVTGVDQAFAQSTYLHK